MSVRDFDLIEAWKQVLTLSKLESGQVVTVLTGAGTHPQVLSTALTAIAALGGVGMRLDLPPANGAKSLSRDPFSYLGTTPLTGNPAAIAALKQSDLVLDLITLLFSPEQLEILKGGTKILLAVDAPEILLRMVPTEQDRERVLAAISTLQAASVMHISSDAGMDLHCPLGEFEAMGEYGFTDHPGRWDHWPSGFVFTWPNDGQASGRIVLDRGDILLPQKSYIRDPIEMTVVDGYVTRIQGGVDAELLIDYMASFGDLEAYAISHIGWGLQPRARWSALGLYDIEATVAQDARAFAGNFLFSLGPNNEAGGSRTTACHIDIPVRQCTIRLDGREVVTRGDVQDDWGAGDRQGDVLPGAASMH